MHYDTAKIRQFFTERFNDTELNIFCFDYFLDVSHDFTNGMTKAQKIQLLMEHCHKDRDRRMPNLMAALQVVRPDQYAEAFPALSPAEPLPPATRNPNQIFISHAHQDAAFAHRLANDLQQQGWEVWIAPESLRLGEKWIDAIERGLEESGIFVLALTPTSVKSRWVRKETNAAIELYEEGKLQFIPLMVQPCQLPLLWRDYQTNSIPFNKDYQAGLQDLLARLGIEYTPPSKPPSVLSRVWVLLRKWNTHLPQLRWAAVIFLLALAVWGVGSLVNNFGLDELEPTQIANSQDQTRIPILGTSATTTPSLTATRPAVDTITPTPTQPTPEPTISPTSTETPTSTVTNILTVKPDPNIPPANAELGETWTRPIDRMVMVYVPGGSFFMGGGVPGDLSFPQHPVSLASFWVDRTEVTNAQYSRCVLAEECAISRYADRGEEIPVVGVSWQDAANYCFWVGGQLPTEAQWEYTARGPESRIYPWGDTLPTCDKANFSGCRVGLLIEVGSYSPVGDSWVGAADMVGNAMEWVGDWSSRDYYEVSPTDNPMGPDTGSSKVLRGGSWYSYPYETHIAAYARIGFPPMSYNDQIGFRCVIPLGN